MKLTELGVEFIHFLQKGHDTEIAAPWLFQVSSNAVWVSSRRNVWSKIPPRCLNNNFKDDISESPGMMGDLLTWPFVACLLSHCKACPSGEGVRPRFTRLLELTRRAKTSEGLFTGKRASASVSCAIDFHNMVSKTGKSFLHCLAVLFYNGSELFKTLHFFHLDERRKLSKFQSIGTETCAVSW